MKEHQKIHPLLVEAIASALQAIFQDQKYADKVIEFSLKKHPKWGSRDRRFFAESVYEIVRWWRYLWWLQNGSEDRANPSLDRNSLISLWATWWMWTREKPPYGFQDKVDYESLKRSLKVPAPPEVKHSIPDWLYKKGVAELGEPWIETLPFLNRQALVYLRTNTLRTSVEKLIVSLEEESVDADLITTFSPNETLALRERKNVFATKTFQKGYFEVQDLGSQQIAPFLEVEPGMRVIDACAGAGGKSLHLAARMKNKGKIIAMDIHEWKLKELRKRATRNGVDIIEAKLIEGQKTIKRLESTADRLLLDVPCSGVGVLRRNPDSKWKLTQAELDRLTQLQQEILSSYSRMVKKGGKMVYSTCSIFPSENEKQIELFLSNNPDWKLLKQKTVMPQEYNSDGFYMALLAK